jgi:ABC-type transporter Mla subunit MlaD
MPSTKKSPSKPPVRPRATQSARALFEKNDRAIDRITKSLEASQKDLAAIGGSLGTGASDLRKDVARLLRDARRDLTKMRNTVRRDVERLQKDVSAASKAKPRRAQPKSSRAKTGAASRTRRKSA